MKFVSGKPAAVIGENLVVADVHAGFEFELQKKGVRIAPQPKALAKEFNELLEESGCKNVVVLGDFKHDVHGFEQRERRLVQEFCGNLNAKLIVIKGNHDSMLEESAFLKVAPVEGIVLREGGKSFGLHHGHAWPAKELFSCDFLLMGNNHPAVEFRDSLGFRWVQKAWVHGELKVNNANKKIAAEKGVANKQEAIVFPAFSSLYAGTPFNRVENFELLGPLFKNNFFDLPNAVAYNLGGVKLGKISGLKN